jgi:DNA-binding LacI/PurR family transcriptional regulator
VTPVSTRSGERTQREARAVTLADVAAAADVHAATVSRALSRPDLVKSATLDRVNAAIDLLGYVPNRAARQLAGGRTAMLAMLVPDITNPFFAAIVQAAQRRADCDDHLVVLADTGLKGSAEVDAVRSLAPHVDAVIVCTPRSAAPPLIDAAAGRPVVLVNREADGVTSVVLDQRRIVALAVQHLRDLGHGSIALVRGPHGSWSARQRERGLATADVRLVGPAAPTFDGGREVLADVLASGATAVVAFNDVMALGLLRAAIEAGVSVPEQLSVVGSDDIAMAAMAAPALTTVAAPLDELATLAVDHALRLVGGGAPERVSVEPRLVERASTAAPA